MTATAGYASDDSLDVARIWTLVTILAAAYVVSRGLAKAGSYEREDREVGGRPLEASSREPQGEAPRRGACSSRSRRYGDAQLNANESA
jgi:hypothetical protein